MFAPLCFPYADHWITVVMWLHEDNYYIRVYNSYPQYRKYDKHVACMFSFLYHKMQPKTKVKWLMRLPHDRLEQRPSDNRCGVFVIARAWQVLCGQFLTHKFTCRENVWSIGSYLSFKFLTYDASLCGDDVRSCSKIVNRMRSMWIKYFFISHNHYVSVKKVLIKSNLLYGLVINNYEAKR